MARKEGVVSHSGDSNDSTSNKEFGSTDAKHILDSIIGHIESTDNPTQADELSLKDNRETDHAVEKTAAVEQITLSEEPQNDRSMSGYRDLERRAADLASRLGGGGLSFGSGAQRHLMNEPEQNVRDDKKRFPEMKASIHVDDMDMETDVIDGPLARRFSDNLLETPERVEAKPHVSEHEADAHWEQAESHATDVDVSGSIEESPSIDSPLLDEMVEARENVVEAEIVNADFSKHDTVRADEDDPFSGHFHVDIAPAPTDKCIANGMKAIADHIGGEGHKDVEPSPELQVIEQQIEALSVSMRYPEEQRGEEQVLDVPSAGFVNVEQSGGITEETNLRIASLEAQIVRLLDESAHSKQALKDTVSEVLRTDTQKAVEDAIASSNLMGLLKSEMEMIAEERRLQEIRTSDSLDALHDALKDIGERVSHVEQVEPAHHPETDAIISLGAGVASMVMNSPVQAENEEPAPLEDAFVPDFEVDTPPVVPQPVDDNLPAWLEDSTQDLHREEMRDVEKQADVFATDPREVRVSDAVELSRVEPEVVPLPEMDRREEPRETELREEPQNITQHQSQVVEVPQPILSDVEPETSKDEWDRIYTPEPKPEATKNSGKDFLHAARAAARAANERTRGEEMESEEPSVEPMETVHNGDFIAAAKQQQMKNEEMISVQRAKAPQRNSLFSDKVARPNSLLVFTSLILFGTSALLLYGMSRNAGNTGSVAKLNAVEKKTDMGLGMPPRVTDKETSAASKGAKSNSDSGNNAIPKRVNDKRSKLENMVGKSEFKLATVDQDEMDDREISAYFEETKSAGLEASTSVPSPYEITGALPDRTLSEKSGSLFDEYVSFSPLSNTEQVKGQKPPAQKNETLAIPYLGASGHLLEAADKGNSIAQYEVARRYAKGIGVRKSPAISVEWYEKSANAGYPPAIYRLATMYERGNGVTKNYNKAMTLYVSAAEKGNVKAMHNLAVLYTGGNLGKADYKNAIKWYEMAAEYGVQDSQFNLAIIYQNGMGGRLDLEKAYKWYTLAARSGDREAKGLVEDVREDLTVVQRRRTDRILREWKAKTPDKNANAPRQYSQNNESRKIAGLEEK